MAEEPELVENCDLDDDQGPPEAAPGTAEAAMTILTNRRSLDALKAISDDWMAFARSSMESRKAAGATKSAVAAVVLVAVAVATYWLTDAGKLKSPETVFLTVVGGLFLRVREK